MYSYPYRAFSKCQGWGGSHRDDSKRIHVITYQIMDNYTDIIPVNRPHIPKHAKKYLDACVSSSWFSSEGPFVKKFEEQFARFLGVKHASATSSGTASLHLAVMALGIG